MNRTVRMAPAAVVGRTVEVKAARSRALVLGDLRRYITEMDQAGAPDSTPLKAHTSPWAGWLRSLSAFAARLQDLDPGRLDWDQLALGSGDTAVPITDPNG